MVLSYILRRAVRHWQLFLILSLGVVLTTMLLASGLLLVDAILEYGLKQKIRSATPSDRNLRLETYELAEEQLIHILDTELQDSLQARFGSWIEKPLLFVDSNWMIPWAQGYPHLDERVNLVYSPGIEAHVEFIAGNWPDGPAVVADTVPVVVGEALALAYDLQVGDLLPLSYSKYDSEASRSLLVTGIIQPKNPSDIYWFTEFNLLNPQAYSGWDAQYSAVLPQERFYPAVAALLPGTQARMTWNVRLKADPIRVENIPALLGLISALRSDASRGKHQFLLTTGLDELLSNYAAQAKAVRGPLFLLLSEIVLLVLYFTVMVATLTVRQYEREFALLQSRGATRWQVLSIQGVEALLIAVLAFLSGPILAQLLLQGFLRNGFLMGTNPDDWILNLGADVWIASAIASGVALVGLLLPVIPAMRRGIVTHLHQFGRPPKAPWWHRMYLDVVLMVVGLILAARLQLHGGDFSSGVSRSGVDWLLMMSPLVLLLGAATILLRVFPLVLRFFANLSSRGRGLPATLAMWQISRNPAQGVVLVLLLTIGTALAVLSTGLNRTLEVNQIERARYYTGSDMRFILNHYTGVLDLTDQPGVLKLAGVLRLGGTVDLGSFRSYPRFETLGIDVRQFVGVTKFRDDFSERPMIETLGLINQELETSTVLVSLPGNPSSLGIWLWSLRDDELLTKRHWRPLRGESDLDRVELRVKMHTALGEYLSVGLYPVDNAKAPLLRCSDCLIDLDSTITTNQGVGEWRFFSAPLPELSSESYPLALHSTWFYNLTRDLDGQRVPLQLRLALGDWTVMDAESGELQRVALPDSADLSWRLDGQESLAVTDADLAVDSVSIPLRLFIDFDYTGKPLALQLEKERSEIALPALASPAFQLATRLNVGDKASVWIGSLPALNIQLVGLVNYLPTLYEEQIDGSSVREAGFIVVPMNGLLALLNRRTPEAVNPNEVWLSIMETTSDEQISYDEIILRVPSIDRALVLPSVFKAIQADPRALGLRGVIFFGYMTTVLLSIVGFATHFYMSARQRSSRHGVLRAMGLSPGQLYFSLVLEQVVLIVSGLALGTVLGVLLNWLVLPGLPVSFGELPPVPPFQAQNDWAMMKWIYIVLGVAFFVSISGATFLLWRAKIHRVLRIGEE